MRASFEVDGFRRPGSARHREGVKGTGEAGGEDKERSGTGAALTPKRGALQGRQPSTWKARGYVRGTIRVTTYLHIVMRAAKEGQCCE